MIPVKRNPFRNRNSKADKSLKVQVKRAPARSVIGRIADAVLPSCMGSSVRPRQRSSINDKLGMQSSGSELHCASKQVADLTDNLEDATSELAAEKKTYSDIVKQLFNHAKKNRTSVNLDDARQQMSEIVSVNDGLSRSIKLNKGGNQNSKPTTVPPQTPINKMVRFTGPPHIKNDKRQHSSHFNISKNRELQKLPLLTEVVSTKKIRSWKEIIAEKEEKRRKELEAKKAQIDPSWLGEDEEDDVKDNWFDGLDDEDKSDKEEKVVSTKKKRSLKKIIAEKEEKIRKELEAEKAQEEEERNMQTPEELLAEKVKQQKLQEESDLEVAKDAFGVTETNSTGIDAINPKTKEEFEEFGKALAEKIIPLSKEIQYVSFLEDLFRNVCVSLESEDIKRLGSALNILGSEKLKALKNVKGKKKSKKGGIRVERVGDFAVEDYGNEYDDDYGEYYN